MGKASSMAKKKKYDDVLMNRIKTCENRGVSNWSDLNNDVLFSVMMRLVGVVDFLAFSGVCKSWRSLALSNMNKFIVSRPPMSISFSPGATKCYLEDFEGRKFSTILPHSPHRMCIGVTCGYLILVWSEIWLVNPITRHELHFPDVPLDIFCFPGYESEYLRGILVFSPSISRWVFALLCNCSPKLCFSIVGTGEWTHVVSRYNFNCSGLHAFNGNIYTLTYVGKVKTVPPVFPLFELRVQEVRLDTEPELVFERFPKPDFTDPKYVTSGENLYVIDLDSKHPDMNIHELDFGKKKWEPRENSGEKYAFFRNKFKNISTITLREVWAELLSQYQRYVVTNKNGEGILEANMWYFFHNCLNANIIHE